MSTYIKVQGSAVLTNLKVATSADGGNNGGGGGENPPENGWFSGTNTYYINSQATTLNEFGDGTWNGDLYSGGVLFTGTSGGVYYVSGSPANGFYNSNWYVNGTEQTAAYGISITQISNDNLLLSATLTYAPTGAYYLVGLGYSQVTNNNQYDYRYDLGTVNVSTSSTTATATWTTPLLSAAGLSADTSAYIQDMPTDATVVNGNTVFAVAFASQVNQIFFRDGWNSESLTYYLSAQVTTLDSSGFGVWNGLIYQYGIPYTGYSGNDYVINGILNTDLNSSGDGYSNGNWYDGGVINNTTDPVSSGFASKISINEYNEQTIIWSVKNITSQQRSYRIKYTLEISLYDEYNNYIGSEFQETYSGDQILAAGASYIYNTFVGSPNITNISLQYNNGGTWVAAPVL